MGFDYAGEPKEPVESCNLCGGDRLAIVTHEDRYGFPAESRACLRCGLVFLSPRLTAEAYGRFYADTYRPLVSAFHGRRIDPETVEADQRPYADALIRLLAPFLEGRGGGTLLDVGGSTGVVARAVCTRLGMHGVVLDPSPAEAERARGRGLEAVVGTIEDWEPGGRAFEAVLLCQTIDHLLDVGGSLRKLRGLLAPNGLLFVDIVDFRAAYLRARSVEAATKIDHPYALTQPVAEAYLSRAGFEILRTDFAPDHLHVGYVCGAGAADGAALPPPASVERLLAEIRFVQSAPRPA